jgi:hypothetical protein
VVVKDGDVGAGAPINPTVWSNDTIYIMVGHIYVEAGHELIIEPGTLIWGTQPGSGWAPDTTNPGALIIARGGYINAQGTRNDPIIFSYGGNDPATADCPDDDDEYTDPNDSYLQWQKWGGIIVLGYADINTDDSTGTIEGIPAGETRATYGHEPPIDDDSSGVMRYVSLRHGGHEIGEANEINGFTFGGVGSRTVLEYLEVYANYDDGYEWFGGKVNGKHLVASYCRDDCFDHDEGYRGCFQYIYAQYTDETGDKNGEHDGGTDPENGLPLADPQYYNATYIGRGAAATCNNKTSTFHIRDNWAGDYYNSLFIEAACWGFYAIENLDPAYGDFSRDDSEKQLRLGELTFNYNMFDGHGTDVWNYVNPNPDKEGYEHIPAYFADTAYNGSAGYYNNHSGPTNDFGINPDLTSLYWDDSDHESLNPMLNTGSPAKGGTMAPIGIDCEGYIDTVDYKGAFDVYVPYAVGPDGTCHDDPCAFWVAYWTKLYGRKHLPQQPPYMPGDATGDANVNIFDVTHLIAYLYMAGHPPQIWEKTGDVNGDGTINIFDVTYLISNLYMDGPDPIGC